MSYSEILESLGLQAGGLIEIYIAETTYEDWRNAHETLEREGYPVALTDIRGDRIDEFGPHLFDQGEELVYGLEISVDHQVWTTSFFSTAAIELQGDPREIRDERDLRDVIRLMTILHQATGKSVSLFAEGSSPETTHPYLMVPGGL